jgi:purine nucleoside permease
MRFFSRLLGLAASLAMLGATTAFAAPLAPKVVIIAYFDNSTLPGQAATPGFWGENTVAAERPGELKAWVEREGLTRTIKVPGAFNLAYANADGSVLAMKVGPNSLHPAVNITALGLDPQFDLSKSYWLITGIAGISPQTGTIGDAVWTDFVVNGGAGHEIDAREMPADWPTGYFPAGKTAPYPPPRVAAGSPDDVRGWPRDAFRANNGRTVVALNRDLARWALGLTRAEPVADDAAMARVRGAYAGYPAAQAAPTVRMGATLSSETFWHGKLLDQRAIDWTRYMTDGVGTFLTTETNDSGAMVALAALGASGRADPNRVLLLRTASNFDMPPPGVTAAQGLADAGPGTYAAYLPALETAHRVGARVIHEIQRHWERYADRPPSP